MVRSDFYMFFKNSFSNNSLVRGAYLVRREVRSNCGWLVRNGGENYSN